MTGRFRLAALLAAFSASPLAAQTGQRSSLGAGAPSVLPPAAAGASVSAAGMEAAQVQLQGSAPAPELSADHATPAPEVPLAQAEANLSALAQEPAVKAAAERGGKPADAQSFHALYDKKPSGAVFSDAVPAGESRRTPAPLARPSGLRIGGKAAAGLLALGASLPAAAALNPMFTTPENAMVLVPVMTLLGAAFGFLDGVVIGGLIDSVSRRTENFLKFMVPGAAIGAIAFPIAAAFGLAEELMLVLGSIFPLSLIAAITIDAVKDRTPKRP